MKPNKKILAAIVILLSIALYSTSFTGTAEAQQEFGAVLVAHGSNDPNWNQQVGDFYANIKGEISVPLERAFLYYNGKNTLKTAVNNLKKDGVTKIVLIHLAPSSYSIRHEEIVDFADDAMEDDPSLEISVSSALDDHPLVVDILGDYADELSRDSENESLILLGLGPIEELENIIWIRQLERIGKVIQSELRFREIACLTLRYYSADLIREKAIIDLRRTVKRLSKTGKVNIVPYMLWQGSFHDELESYLKNVVPADKIAISDKSLLSDSQTELKNWVEEIISRKTDQPKVRAINRTWSAKNAKMADKVKYEYGRVKVEKKEKGR